MRELLEHANTWARSLQQDPGTYARPYEWTLSPLTIAEGPPPPNASNYEHAQDVLQFCARERNALLDQVSKVQWYLEHPDKYDWTTTSITPQVLSDAVREWQLDLDTVAHTASHAMNDVTGAVLPAAYAQEVESRQYRAVVMPDPLPQPFPADLIDVVSLVGLRLKTVRTVLDAPPDFSYQQYLSWCDDTYETGTSAVRPSQAQYEFLTSGITVDGHGVDVGAPTGVFSFWSWVNGQQPATGRIAPTGTVTVTLEQRGGGGVPDDLRQYWDL
jgi:hypothetical protein